MGCSLKPKIELLSYIYDTVKLSSIFRLFRVPHSPFTGLKCIITRGGGGGGVFQIHPSQIGLELKAFM